MTDPRIDAMLGELHWPDEGRRRYLAGESMERVLVLLPTAERILFVERHADTLVAAGRFEESLLMAHRSSSTWSIPRQRVVDLWRRCDPARLPLGDPLPPGETFTAFRGVAGLGRRRRPNGLSWSLDIGTARWFALATAQTHRLPDPGVYRAEIARADVLAYIAAAHELRERELVAVLPPGHRVERVG